MSIYLQRTEYHREIYYRALELTDEYVKYVWDYLDKNLSTHKELSHPDASTLAKIYDKEEVELYDVEVEMCYISHNEEEHFTTNLYDYIYSLLDEDMWNTEAESIDSELMDVYDEIQGL